MPNKIAATPIAILGMHRSGTSCLTGLLKDSGVWLGAVSKENPHNAKGNQESIAVMNLHEQVLADSHAAWDSPPVHDCVWQAQRIIELKKIIATYPSDRVWAVKDPRACFTITEWKRQLPNLTFIGTFRHPTAVAASLNKRDPTLPPEKGVSLWCQYNRKLLELHAQYQFPIVCFDLPARQYLEQISSAFSILGLRLAPAEATFFDVRLRSTLDKQIPSVSKEATAIYRELSDHAG